MKRLNLLFIPLVCLFAHSCDFLNPASESAFDDSAIFSDYTLANGAVMGIYESINDKAFVGRLWPYHGYNNDVEICIGSVSGLTQTDRQYAYAVYKYSEGDNFFGDAFNGAMMAIERANNCIEGLEKYGDVENDGDLACLLGEALFLRAWIYWELVNLWGDLPARFESISNETLYLGRSDRDVIWKQLLADLERASLLMPWPGNKNTTSVFRPNRAAAKALRARIALAAGGWSYHLYGQPGVPQLSEDPDLSRNITYGIARKECLELIENEGNGYKLESDFGKIFKDNCQALDLTGSEPLWELPFKYNSRGNWMVAAGVIHSGKGGSGQIESGTDPYTTVYMGGTMCLSPTLYYDYDKEDKRRDITIVPFRWANGVQELSRIDKMTCGKLRAEWIDLSKGKLNANANDGIAPIILRYADVLLMFAEAENELNGPTDAAQSALKRVRERAFGSDQSSYVESVSTDKDSFFKAIKDERKFELAGELVRKSDLIRWNELKTAIDANKESMRDLAARSGDYSDVPAFVFWKYKPGQSVNREIEWCGFERGEVIPGIEGGSVVDNAQLTAWMTAGGWNNYNYKGNSGAPVVEPRSWLVNLTEEFIGAMYHTDPDTRQVMPLPSSVIMNSQGSLDNSYLGYGN